MYRYESRWISEWHDGLVANRARCATTFVNEEMQTCDLLLFFSSSSYLFVLFNACIRYRQLYDVFLLFFCFFLYIYLADLSKLRYESSTVCANREWNGTCNVINIVSASSLRRLWGNWSGLFVECARFFFYILRTGPSLFPLLAEYLMNQPFISCCLNAKMACQSNIYMIWGVLLR